MAASVRWSDQPPKKDARPSYPFRSSGGKFNQSKGPRLYSSVSPTLEEREDDTPLAAGDATYNSDAPAYNDAMNMSSQISADMTKYWTRESASAVKRWDTEVGRHSRRASPVKYNPNLRDSRKGVPMGIMPLPGAGVGIDLTGQRLPNRWEMDFCPAAAQVPEQAPKPESEEPGVAPVAISAAEAPSPELQAYLSTNGDSNPAAAAQATSNSLQPTPSVSFDAAALTQSKASMDEVPKQAQLDLAVPSEAGVANGNGKGRIAHGRRRGSPTRRNLKKPGGGGSYGVITGAVHQSRGVQRQALPEQTGRRPLGTEARSGQYRDRRAAQFGGHSEQGSAWAADSGVDRFGRAKTTRAKVEEELLAGPNALSPTRLSPLRRGKRSPAKPAANTRHAIPDAVPPVVVHKA